MREWQLLAEPSVNRGECAERQLEQITTPQQKLDLADKDSSSLQHHSFIYDLLVVYD